MLIKCQANTNLKKAAIPILRLDKRESQWSSLKRVRKYIGSQYNYRLINE